MSSISITENNISRFNKRLQKSLEKHFSKEIPLHLASLILAETFGLDTVHHLQQKLSEPEQDECEKIKKMIELYLQSNTNIVALSFIYEKDNISFNVAVKSDKYGQESFGIFFGKNPSYIEKYLKNLQLNSNDISFINALIRELHFDDIPKNIYLAEKLKEHLKINNHGVYEFKLNNNLIEITNYAYCEHFFVTVNEDFFERVGASFALNNDKYSSIDLTEEEEVNFYSSFDQAYKKLISSEDIIIMEFLTPLNKLDSNKDSIYKKEGISSHYLYKEDNQIKASTVNGDFSETIEKIDDYYHFLGTNEFNIDPNKQRVMNKYPVNHPYRIEVEKGFDSCMRKSTLKSTV